MQVMSALDDDATLTQLATAWVDVYLVSVVCPAWKHQCIEDGWAWRQQCSEKCHGLSVLSVVQLGSRMYSTATRPPSLQGQGGAKVREAAVIYQELGDKYNWTARLYNGAAVCAMQMGEWEDAEKELQAGLSVYELHVQDFSRA